MLAAANAAFGGQPPIPPARLRRDVDRVFDRQLTRQPRVAIVRNAGVPRLRLQQWPVHCTRNAYERAYPAADERIDDVLVASNAGPVQGMRRWMPLEGAFNLRLQAPSYARLPPPARQRDAGSAMTGLVRDRGVAPDQWDEYSAVWQFVERAVGPRAQILNTWSLTFEPDAVQEALRAGDFRHARMTQFVALLAGAVAELIYNNIAVTPGVGAKFSVSLNSVWLDARDDQQFPHTNIAPPIVVPVMGQGFQQIRNLVRKALIRDDHPPSLLNTMINMQRPDAPSNLSWLYASWVLVTKVAFNHVFGRIWTEASAPRATWPGDIGGMGRVHFRDLPVQSGAVYAPLPEPWSKLHGNAVPITVTHNDDNRCFYYSLWNGVSRTRHKLPKDFAPAETTRVLFPPEWDPVLDRPVPCDHRVFEEIEALNPWLRITVVVLDPMPIERVTSDDMASALYRSVWMYRFGGSPDSEVVHTDDDPDADGLLHVWLAWYRVVVPGSPCATIVHWATIRNVAGFISHVSRQRLGPNKKPSIRGRKAVMCPRCFNVCFGDDAHARHRVTCDGGFFVQMPGRDDAGRPPVVTPKPDPYPLPPKVYAVFDFESSSIRLDAEDAPPTDSLCFDGDSNHAFLEEMKSVGWTEDTPRKLTRSVQIPSAVSIRVLHEDGTTLYAEDYPRTRPDGSPIPFAAHVPGLNDDEDFGPLSGRGPYAVAQYGVRAMLGLRALVARRFRLPPASRWYMPFFAHNGGRYDALMLIKAASCVPNANVRVLPRNARSFITVNIGQISIVDSALFMRMSLDKAVRMLNCERPKPNESEDAFDDRATRSLRVLRDNVAPFLGDDWHLASLKGTYMYDRDTGDEYLSSWAGRFPPPEEFTSILHGNKLPDPDTYARCKTMFEKHCHGSMHDFRALYCISDTCLLADCLRAYDRFVSAHWGVRFFRYPTAPSMFFDAFLKTLPPEVRGIEQLNEEDMFLFARMAIKGGFAGSIGPKLARANYRGLDRWALQGCPTAAQACGLEDNPFGGLWDPSRPDSYIVMLDVNSMYATALWTICVPYKDHAWMPAETVRDVDAMRALFMNYDITDETKDSIVAEIDIDMPDLAQHPEVELWPLLPTHVPISVDMLSPEQQDALADDDRAKDRLSDGKLCLHMLDLKHAVFHAHQIKHALEHGYRLKKVHRAMTSKQAPLFRDYVANNNAVRRGATNDLENAIGKQASNDVYGYTARKPERARPMAIINDVVKLLDMASSTSYVTHRDLGGGVTLVETARTTVTCTSVPLVAVAVLAHSKTQIADGIYRLADDLKGRPSLRGQLPITVEGIYTDTDSFSVNLLNASDEDWAAYVRADHDSPLGSLIDASNYPDGFAGLTRAELCRDKAKLGLFKDEHPFPPMLEMVVIRPKEYSVIDAANGHCAKLKGVGSAERSALGHSSYLQAARGQFGKEGVNVQQHRLDTDPCLRKTLVTVTKRGLTSTLHDHKAWIADGGYVWIPFGHPSLRARGHCGAYDRGADANTKREFVVKAPKDKKPAQARWRGILDSDDDDVVDLLEANRRSTDDGITRLEADVPVDADGAYSLIALYSPDTELSRAIRDADFSSP